MKTCIDCKYGGVYGDELSMDFLEYRCSKHGDIKAYVYET